MGGSDRELTGRVAIVTGAGAGIGAGIAAMLAEAGAAVTVADIDGESAASTAKGIESKGGRAITVTADVSDAREIDAMVRQTVTDLGGVDILVNNASIATTELVEDLDEEKWRGVLDVNLTGPFLCCKAVLPHMRRKRWGRIERRAGRRRWTLPSTRRGDASPTPWTRGGRRGSDCARFGELLARALLRALARRDAGVHQDIALAGDKGGPGLDPREPFVERGAELPADLV